jgi:hypothetical protein
MPESLRSVLVSATRWAAFLGWLLLPIAATAHHSRVE